jgi:hypothetical protein
MRLWDAGLYIFYSAMGLTYESDYSIIPGKLVQVYFSMADKENAALQDRVYALEPAFAAVEQDYEGCFDFKDFCSQESIKLRDLEIIFETDKDGGYKRDVVPTSISVERTPEGRVITSTWSVVDPTWLLAGTMAVLEIKGGQLVQENSNLLSTGQGREDFSVNHLDTAVVLTE